jgi:hypothetical protein
MSLVDLKSDLSKYRSDVSREDKNTPDASKATSAKNFATLQPITDRLASMSPEIKRPKQTNLVDMLGKTTLDDIRTPKTSSIESKLNSTKFDDIVKKAAENLLINQVSQYSAINTDFNPQSAISVSTDDVISQFNQIRRSEFTSRLNSSEIVINRSISGENNNTSDVNINPSQQTFDRQNTSPDILKNQNDSSDNITNPDVTINRSEQTFDRQEQSPNVIRNVGDATDNITNPKIVIDRSVLSTDRSNQSAVIDKNRLSPINNIVNPDIALQRTVLSEDRTKQSAKIFTENLPFGFITIPEIEPLTTDLSSIHLTDESFFNIDSKPKPYNQFSVLAQTEPLNAPNFIRYDQQSKMLQDTSQYNADTVIKTNPSGRNEDPTKSSYSTVGTQEVNFFPNINADGFTAKQSVGDSKFKSDSVYGWSGKTSQAPAVNYISDINADGFDTFAEPLVSAYVVNSSKFGFLKIPEADFFDNVKKYTSVGFKSFTRPLDSAYKVDSSVFGWTGKPDAAPEGNYFDVRGENTTSGFHKFAQLYDTKYIVDSSGFDWDGGRESAPEANYFDITGQHSTVGFHKFAQVYDTKYVQESSLYDWDGTRDSAPEANYFDITGQHSTAGFHKFAQIYDTKYIPESSIFDWDGTRESAPEINYFDLTSQHSTAGFHRFAALYDTKYIPEASVFDWDGARQSAPNVNYFDLTSQHSTAGFHSFAALYDTKYIPEASIFDWDGARTNAPQVNYFDLTGQHTTIGFHSFAALYDTKYIPEASIFDWDGFRVNAPFVNYFDISGRNTNAGFHTFAQLYDTKYVHESSIFDWDGFRVDAPFVNYFDITGKNTNAGFHTFAQLYDTKYVHESSVFDWDGFRPDAPFVNYFDITGKNTNAGFHTFAQLYDTKYVHESSIFDWDGFRPDAPRVNYFDLSGRNTTIGFHTFAQIYDTKYVHESSIFDWDGFRTSAPEVNYFDLPGKFTTKGFHRLAQIYDTKYIKESSGFDWDGGRSAAPEVNYFDLTGKFTTIGFHRLAEKYDTKYIPDSSEFDWDGGRSEAPEVNYFQNETATGFTKFPRHLDSEYKKDISKFTFKGNLPTPINYFPDSFNAGFTLKVQKLQSEYVEDKSEFTWKGSRNTAPQVDYFTNDSSPGFTTFASALVTEYKKDISGFSWKGARSDAPAVDYIGNISATGFLTFPPLLESKYNKETSLYTWNGGRSNAPRVNFIEDNFAQGFTSFSQRPLTDFINDIGGLNWKGTKRDAPTVKYFSLNNISNFVSLDIERTQQTVASILNTRDSKYSGFSSFFSDKTTTKLSPYYSSLSAQNNTIRDLASNKTVTNFFGFLPYERRNFKPNFNSPYESQLPFPNSDPNADRFFDTENGVKLVEKYTNRLLFSVPYNRAINASIYNQRPGGRAYNAIDLGRYELTALAPGGVNSENQDFKSPMAQYMTTTPDDTTYSVEEFDQPAVAGGSRSLRVRQNGQTGILRGGDRKFKRGKNTSAGGSDGIVTGFFPRRFEPDNLTPLEAQYSKYDLRTESFNPGLGDRWRQPFIVRGVQAVGRKKAGDSLLTSFNWGKSIPHIGSLPDEGVIRGGIATVTGRIAADVERIGLWLTSTPGLIWVVKQAGLQFMNPNVDTDPKSLDLFSLATGKSSTQIYNPLSILANVATAPLGIHLTRHGLAGSFMPDSLNKYEKATVNRELEVPPDPASSYFKSLPTPTNDGDTFNYSRLIGLMKELLPNSFNPIDKTSTDITEKSRIARISTNFGGPNAPLGIGGTKISRATHPYLTMYTTSPILDNSSRNPAYMETAKRDTFYAVYDKNFVSGSKYSDKVKSDYTTTQNTIYGVIRSLLTVVSSDGVVITETGEADSVSPSLIPVQEDTVTRLISSDPFTFKRDNLYDRLSVKTQFNSTRNGVPLERNLPEIDETDKIKKYRTVAYSRIGKPKLGQPIQGRSRTFNDFRHDVQWKSSGSTQNGAEAFISDPRIMRFHTRNMEDYFGLGKQGKVGAQRNIPFLNTVTHAPNLPNGLPIDNPGGPKEFESYPLPKLKAGSGSLEFRGDRINIIDYKRANFNITHDLVYEKNNFNKSIPGTEDLIDFYFTSLVLSGHNYCPAEVIVFRATFDSIQDTHSPKWNPVKYMGRADPLYVYDGYERSINFGFTVHIGSRDEMKATWRKLNFLASWTAPEYTKAGYIRGPMIRLNIGHLYRKMPGFISSLTYTFDNQNSTWETAHLPEDMKYALESGSPGVLQLPKTVQISVGFTPIGVYRPEFRGIMYSLYDDTGASPENGLVPNAKDKVNYFRAYDSVDMDDELNLKYLPENTVVGAPGTDFAASASIQNTLPFDVDGNVVT